MWKLATLLLAVSLLSGCAATDAQRQAGAQAVGSQDDAVCRGYGAAPGTPTYVHCRMNLANQRAAAEQADDANQAALGAAWLGRRH